MVTLPTEFSLFSLRDDVLILRGNEGSFRSDVRDLGTSAYRVFHQGTQGKSRRFGCRKVH